VVGWWVYWYGFRYKLIQIPCQAMDTEVGRQILVEMWWLVGALGDKGESWTVQVWLRAGWFYYYMQGLTNAGNWCLNNRKERAWRVLEVPRLRHYQVGTANYCASPHGSAVG